jgi:hypothetical protein
VSQRGGSVDHDTDRHATIATFVGTHEEVDPWMPLLLRVDVGEILLFDLSTGARIDTSA